VNLARRPIPLSVLDPVPITSGSGAAQALANTLDLEACDGFILVPHLTPGGLDRLAVRCGR
jgi:hypothetical protein